MSGDVSCFTVTINVWSCLMFHCDSQRPVMFHVFTVTMSGDISCFHCDNQCLVMFHVFTVKMSGDISCFHCDNQCLVTFHVFTATINVW